MHPEIKQLEEIQTMKNPIGQGEKNIKLIRWK